MFISMNTIALTTPAASFWPSLCVMNNCSFIYNCYQKKYFLQLFIVFCFLKTKVLHYIVVLIKQICLSYFTIRLRGYNMFKEKPGSTETLSQVKKRKSFLKTILLQNFSLAC